MYTYVFRSVKVDPFPFSPLGNNIVDNMIFFNCEVPNLLDRLPYCPLENKHGDMQGFPNTLFTSEGIMVLSFFSFFDGVKIAM